MDSTALTVVRNEVEPCRIKLDIEVPAAQVKPVFEKALKEYHKHVRIPGFRPGKAPRGLLLSRYGKEIREEAIRQLVRTSVDQALDQEKITPETQPRILDDDKLALDPEQSFIFSISFDTAPEFELPEYKGLKATRAEAAVDEAAVQAVIDQWLEQRASYEKVDRPAEAGDLLKASYKGQLLDAEGVELAESAKFLMEADNTWLSLREPEILPGCTELLAGVEAGTEKTITVEFPETYFDKSLAGQKAEYVVTVAEVHAAQTPELTDEMAQSMGIEDAAQMRENVRRHLESNHEAQQQEAVRRQVMDTLMAGLEFPLPPSLLQRETYEALRRALEQHSRSGKSPDQLQSAQGEMMDEARQNAASRLRQSFVLRAIAEKEKIEVSGQELDQAIAELSRIHKMSPKILARRLSDNGRIADLYTQLCESKTVERLIELAEIQDSNDN